MTGIDRPWLCALFAVLTLGCGGAEEAEPVAETTPEGEVKRPTEPDPPTPDNGPPTLSPIGDRLVPMGETLVITLEATDPEDDKLTFTITGSLPEGARFIKEDRRFEWTPETAGEVVYLTFVVTDGTEFDRETVRMEVTTGDDNHAPALSPIGDQIAVVGETLKIILSATDPDGDSVTYGVAGDVPEAASFDPYKGLFTWSPSSGDGGANRLLTFSVTDGELEDTEAVTLVVSASAGDGPGLPVFAPIGEQVATVGESLSFQVSAESPGGVEAEIAMEVDPPPGSSLGSGLFTWTPTLAEVGQSWTVTFSATAEGLTAYLSVDILVVSGGDEVACADDPGEPNGTLSTATPLEEGTLEASICDTDLVPLDSDVYAVNLDAGETLEITVEFDPLNGDLELELVDQALTPLAVGNTVGSQETVTWTSSAATQVYVVVYGIGQSVFHAPYTLTLTTKTDGTCVDDVYEEELGIPSLPGPNETLTLCPGDEDWWSVLLFCGESALFTLDAGGTGDLDMYLWDPDSSGDGLLASGATGAAIETLEVPSVPHSGNYHLKVVGWPPGTGAGTYTLEMDYSGGCVDKGVKSNHKASDAWPLDGAEGALPDQRLCCDDDWYLLTMNAGQTGLVDVLVTSDGGSAGITVYAPGGTQPVASGAPGDSGSLVEVQASESGVYVVQVEGSAGTDYDLEWLVD